MSFWVSDVVQAEVEAGLRVEIRGMAVLQDPLECTRALHHPTGTSHGARLTEQHFSWDAANVGQQAG